MWTSLSLSGPDRTQPFDVCGSTQPPRQFRDKNLVSILQVSENTGSKKGEMFTLLFRGVRSGYVDPPKKRSFLLHFHHREITAYGQLQNSTPCFWEQFNVLLTETSAWWMFALTLLFQLKNSFPALFTTQPCSWYSHCISLTRPSRCSGRHGLSFHQRGHFIFWVLHGNTKQRIFIRIQPQ